MKNKKAIICTVLFAVVFVGAIVSTIFIKNESFSLYELFANFIVMMWTWKRIENFYNWLTEE